MTYYAKAQLNTIKLKRKSCFFDVEAKFTDSYPQNWWITG
jgi:hypothetical protein